MAAAGRYTSISMAEPRPPRTAAIEARKPFEAEGLNLYLRASSAAATLATSHSENERDKAERELWTATPTAVS